MASTTDRTPTGSPAHRLAWLLVGVLLGLSLLVWLPRGRSEAVAPGSAATAATTTTTAADGATAVEAAAPELRAATAALAPSRVLPMNRANRAIELGLDLHALAVELLPRAEAGDAEAQYSLMRIVETCEHELARFGDEAALAARRDELMERAAGIHGPAAAALDEERYRMCDGFRRDDLARLGERDAWLLRAAEQGHPLASVALAVELDRGSPDGVPLTDAERVARQRQLFLVGLGSGRPEALLEGFAFDPGDAQADDGWAPSPQGVAWLLLACARGLECSRAARWRRELEAFGGLPPYEDWAEALLFDLPSYQREAAMEHARAIAAALDRGDIEAALPGALREGAP
jgi:hypothetical protein